MELKDYVNKIIPDLDVFDYAERMIIQNNSSNPAFFQKTISGAESLPFLRMIIRSNKEIVLDDDSIKATILHIDDMEDSEYYFISADIDYINKSDSMVEQSKLIRIKPKTDNAECVILGVLV